MTSRPQAFVPRRDGAPLAAQPQIRRLGGEVREVAVPPLAKPITRGSLADLPYENAFAAPADVVLSRRAGDGTWREVTAEEFAAQVHALAKGLAAEGLRPGDRLAVMSRTSYEWTLLDFAAWAAGLVVVPVHPTASVWQTLWILRDSAAVALVTETSEQAALLGPELHRLPGLRHLWVVEKGHTDRLAERGEGVMDAEIEVRRGMLGPDSLATVVHTSGTTGHPKGCALTHGNLFAQVDNAIELLHPVFHARQDEEPSTLLFLPMAHVFGRMIAVACVRARVRLGHAASLNTADLLDDLASFRPTFLPVVPYLLEKVFHTARAKAERGGRGPAFTRAANAAIRWGEAVEARRTGAGPGPGAALKAARALHDPLVYRRIRAALGGRVRQIVCGGAPLDRDLAAFYTGVGLEVYEGYGLTECTGAATVTPPDRPRLGTVGRPVPGTKVRIATDGEILLQGASVMRGYWDLRAGVVDAAPDGWFPTGDLGSLDDEGYLTITGRKKELLITAGGKAVAPAPLENRLRAHPLVSQCMVVGDRRPYVAALLTLDMAGVTHWRHMNGRQPAPAEALVDDPEVLAALQQAVDEANQYVSRAESIRRFLVLPRDLTEAEGHLTPMRKLRRDVVAADFAAEIEKLYVPRPAGERAPGT